jgi:hypothetical protein
MAELFGSGWPQPWCRPRILILSTACLYALWYLGICKFARAKRSRICQDVDAATPSYGYCAAHNAHYFGYKIHAVCTPQGVVLTFDISNAATHDTHYLNDLKTPLNHCILVGDNMHHPAGNPDAPQPSRLYTV